MKKLLSLLLVLSLLLGPVLPAATFADVGDTVELKILGTSDIHGAVNSWSYENGSDRGDTGLARVAGLVEKMRAENPNTLLIDNGDTLQGTILADDLYNADLALENPMIALMNAMEYDAMVLGNHEFNFGLELVEKVMDEANFPILSANIYDKETGENYATPYIIKEVAGVRVAILGLTVPSIPRWDGPKVESLTFKHLGDEAAKYVAMIEEEGADVIIVSAHSGLESRHEPDEADAAKHILTSAPGIDALLVGHDHRSIAEEMNGILVGAPAAGGDNEVVQFDFELTKTADGWEVTGKDVMTVALADVEPSEEVSELAEPYHQMTLEFLSNPIGVATADFHPESEVPGIPEAQIRDTAVMDLINQVQLDVTGADVSAAALFSSSSNIAEGEVSYSDVFDIYKYPNTLYAVEVNGAELKEYMEWSAAYYNTYEEGDVTISFNPEIRGYNYDMFAGVDYKVDISKPVGERIVDLTYKGEPVTDDMTFNLTINNYRFGGLQSMGIISNDAYFKSDPISLRSYIRDHIASEGTITPTTDNNWEIIGADLGHPMRDEIIAMVNEGVLTVPKSEDGRTPNVKSLNVYELAEQGVITLEGEEAPLEMPETMDMDTYVVVSGDVLWRIAQARGTTWEKLAEMNELANPNLIFPGQELEVPVQ